MFIFGDSMSSEVYENLSAENVFSILKQKIESGKDFTVIFKDDSSILSIYIEYDYKKNRYELNVLRLIFTRTPDVKIGSINIPDYEVIGIGHLYTPKSSIKTLSVGVSGNVIKIWRLNNTLYFSKILSELVYTNTKDIAIAGIGHM